MKNNIYLLIIGLLVLSNCNKQTKEIQVNPKIKKFQLVLDSIYKTVPNAKGLMVHIEAPKQNISWNYAVGITDTITNNVLQKDHPVLIASNVKMYVSVAILRLIEDKKITLFQPIKSIITPKTKELLTQNGYNLDSIKVAHLLSHTSGIRDYVNPDYMDFITNNKKHRWTREEQIALSVKVGKPLGKPEFTFSYADVNYLILTEIIENATNKKFYTAIRELIDYKKHQLKDTWWISLEEKPKATKNLACQYWGEYKWDSYEIDPSFDLYGGGGIASTSKDLARFSQLLFEGKIIKDKATLDLIYTKIETQDEKFSNYYMGLTQGEINGLKMYGHGGFWGTAVNYSPDLDSSISVFVLERDERILRKNVVEKMMEILNKK